MYIPCLPIHLVGEIEGNLGSVRCFAVLPKFHGLCIGQRLLAKVENDMRKLHCVRMMFSVPSPRKTVCSWLERRNFVLAGSIPYPDAIGHSLLSADVKLDIMLRAISSTNPLLCALEADSKTPPSSGTILSLNVSQVTTEEGATTTTVSGPRKGISLPPHWRPDMYTSKPSPNDVPVIEKAAADDEPHIPGVD